MHVSLFNRFTGASLLAGAALLALAVPSRAVAADQNADAFPTYDSYIKLTGQTPWITGNGAAAASRLKSSQEGAAGIEDLRFYKDVSRTDALTLEGRALTGTEDYLAHLNYLRADVGSVDIGYKRFRTFYDGVGGFFPVTSFWSPLKPEDLHLDRGSFWAEFKVNLKDQPVYTLRYTNETRDGRKDSLSWGDTDNSGLAKNTLNAGLGVNNSATIRKVVPSYRSIDERVQNLEASIKATSGGTITEVRVFREETSKRDNQYVVRFPGETSPVTGAFAAVTVVAGTDASQWATFGNQVIQSTDNNEDTRTVGITGTLLTPLSAKVNLRAGLSFQNTSADSSGDRAIISNTPTGHGFVGGTAVTTTYAAKDLAAQSKVRTSTATLALEFKPKGNFNGSLGLRAEDRFADATGVYNVTGAPNANLDLGGGVKPVTGTTVPFLTRRFESTDTADRSLTPALDVRYSGFSTVALYASVTQKNGWGIENITAPYNPDLDPRVIIGSTPANPFNQIINPAHFHSNVRDINTDYTLGATWLKFTRLNVRAEVFHKDHDDRVTGYNTSAIAAGVLPVPAPTLDNNYEMATQRSGGKLTVIAQATDTLTFSTRYIYAVGKMQLTGFQPTLPTHESMDQKNHTISETIDWNPTTQFYVQASGTVVFNYMTTGFPTAGDVATTGVIPFNRIVQASNNNYTTTSIIAGAVLTKADDLQAQFTSYNAKDGSANSQIALYGVAYGADASESTATVSLKHKFTDRIIGTAKVCYIDSKNNLTGGRTNFHGPMAYVSVAYGL